MTLFSTDKVYPELHMLNIILGSKLSIILIYNTFSLLKFKYHFKSNKSLLFFMRPLPHTHTHNVNIYIQFWLLNIKLTFLMLGSTCTYDFKLFMKKD